MNKSFFIFLLIVIFCFACNGNTYDIYQLIKKYNIDVGNENSVLIVVPVQGCSDCVDSTLAVMKRFKEYEEITYIFSSITKKNILIRLKKYNLVNQKNYMIDKGDFANKWRIVNKSPKAFLFKDSKLEKVFTLNYCNIADIFKQEIIPFQFSGQNQ